VGVAVKIDQLRAPGVRAIRLDIELATALHVWFALHASMHAEDTTRETRLRVVGLLPQIQRLLVANGAINHATAEQFVKHMASKPAPPSLDDTIAALRAQGDA
jgi:hypothetical protein